jgi:FG-GAP repeat protein
LKELWITSQTVALPVRSMGGAAFRCSKTSFTTGVTAMQRRTKYLAGISAGIFVCLALAAVAGAQGQGSTTLFTFFGDSEFDTLGKAVSTAGDVNGDGRADLLVGAPGDVVEGKTCGRAFVFSGQDGTTLYTFSGQEAAGQFGRCVSAVGDVDRDGYGDFIIGGDYYRQSYYTYGLARVFSGLDGRALHTFHGSAVNELLHNNGVFIEGQSDTNVGNWDQIIDVTDDQTPWDQSYQAEPLDYCQGPWPDSLEKGGEVHHTHSASSF